MNTKIPVCSQALAGLSSENGETPEQAELGAQRTQAWRPSLFAGLSIPRMECLLTGLASLGTEDT